MEGRDDGGERKSNKSESQILEKENPRKSSICVFCLKLYSPMKTLKFQNQIFNCFNLSELDLSAITKHLFLNQFCYNHLLLELMRPVSLCPQER